MSEFVRPDEFTAINTGEATYVVNAKYDRVDYFPRLGHYVLKVYDDEAGLMSMHLSDDGSAERLIEEAELPIVERDWMYASEHESYVEAQAANLENIFEDPES